MKFIDDSIQSFRLCVLKVAQQRGIPGSSNALDPEDVEATGAELLHGLQRLRASWLRRSSSLAPSNVL